MSTIYDIAREANVSVMTVSRFINNPSIVSKKTSTKIQHVMDSLGYQPSQIARSLIKKKTNTIGIVLPNIKNTFFNTLFRHIEDYASQHKYNLLLCNSDDEPEKEIKYIKLFQSQRVDGILLVPAASSSVDYLQKCGIKYVLIDRKFDGPKDDFVVTDHYEGAYNATEHLIKLGHKNIAVLKGSGAIHPDTARYNGFADAMKHHKISVNPEFVIDCGFEESRAFESVKFLMKKKNKPTAIFSFNSLMMTGTIKALHSIKVKIPDQISLICFDEIPGYDIYEPKITCVIQPVEDLGNIAIKQLFKKIEQTNTRIKRIVLQPTLVLGNSCRRIK